jgi:hypothetical protein
MPRLNKLDDVLFPVEEHPVFVNFTDHTGERRLAVPEKKAIVNRNTSRVLGIVSRGYRLVRNQEALDMAHKCCGKVFSETKISEWGVQATDAPNTGGYCHIDLVHKSNALDFKAVFNAATADQHSEVFGPFIRVTNSYNGRRALAFDIGFYRKVCTNGLIIPESIISFKFTHQRRDIGETIQFDIANDKLAKFKTTFTDSLAGLRNCAVARQQFEPIIFGVLSLRRPEPLKPDSRDATDWQKLNYELGEMSNRYEGELGANAYAVFNAITEFASHPPENRCVHRDRHSLQRLAGTWLTSFNSACREPSFSITSHLKKFVKGRAEAKHQRN